MDYYKISFVNMIESKHIFQQKLQTVDSSLGKLLIILMFTTKEKENKKKKKKSITEHKRSERMQRYNAHDGITSFWKIVRNCVLGRQKLMWEVSSERMQWYNAAGGTISLGHQSSRDRSDVLDVVTTKDDAKKDYHLNRISTNRGEMLKRKIQWMNKKENFFLTSIPKTHIWGPQCDHNKRCWW